MVDLPAREHHHMAARSNGWPIAAGVMVAAVATWLSGLPTSWQAYWSLTLVGALFLPLVVPLVGGLEKMMLSLFVFSLQLQLYYTPVYWPYPKPAGPNGIHISVTLLSAIGLVTVWAGQRLRRHSSPFTMDRPFLAGTLCFLLTGILSTANTASLTLTAYGLFEVCGLILINMAATHWCATRKGIRTVCKIMLLCALFQSTVLIVQNLTGVEFSLTDGIEGVRSWEDTRFTGTFARPSSSGTYLGICLLFVVVRLFSSTRQNSSWKLSVLFGMTFLALLASRTRSAWVGFAIGGSGVAWHFYRQGRLSARRMASLAMMGVIVFIIALPVVKPRLGEAQLDSLNTRWRLILIAFEMIKQHPFLGCGLNTATLQVEAYRNTLAQATGYVWVYIVHNQYLLIAVENGIFSLVGFVSLLWMAMSAACRCTKSGDPLIQETAVTLKWTLMLLAWALLIDQVTAAMTYSILWFMMGVARGLHTLRRREMRFSTAIPPQTSGRLTTYDA